ncbi:piggyBac transposable element-derived protein 4-like [Mytilus californianus]|uniref:piggyBac transposable element-derived protein 4-like n=1 Tax=Mytilus californianus TaxID=6549 RepID=UPI00224694E4|nr:piggyBac transposable element-derived protein 4-like [Mytilus californianus]
MDTDLISSDEEDYLDLLLQDGDIVDDTESYTTEPEVFSSQDSSQSLYGDTLAKSVYWKDENTFDDSAPDPRTKAFKPEKPPGFQFANFTRKQLQGLKSPADFFKLFCTVELLTQICIATNNQARTLISAGMCTSYTSDGAWELLTVNELLRFVGIVIYMSVVKLSTVDKYWSTDVLYKSCPIRDVMSKKRFLAILSFIQVTSPAEVDKGDKLTRMRYLLDHVKEISQSLYFPHKDISADERMVASKHKYSGIRQFIKDKPIRFGIKLWVLACSVTGYTWNFFVYLGKKRTNIVDKSKGLAYTVVTTLCEKLYGQGFRLYVDSFYTTLHLANDLLTNKVYLMGAVRSNSTAMPLVFKQSVDWSKLVSRGDFRWHREGSFVFIQWKDCKTVTLMSPLHKGSDVTSCYRTISNRSAWKRQNIKQPLVIHDYNVNMGGVDLSNQYLNKYSSYIRTQSHWWKVLFFHCFDIMVVNSYIVFQEFIGKYPAQFENTTFDSRFGQLEFRESIASELMNIGRSSVENIVTKHMPSFLSNRKDCVYCNAKASMDGLPSPSHKVFSFCNTCHVPLCCSATRNCFYQWHTEVNVQQYVSQNGKFKKRKLET